MQAQDNTVSPRDTLQEAEAADDLAAGNDSSAPPPTTEARQTARAQSALETLAECMAYCCSGF